MITKIEITGFKSFCNFVMEFAPFTVIAGKNASGKSNLFDALELLSRLASHNLKEAFPDRRGTVTEQFTLLGEHEYAKTMSFAVELLVNRQIKDNWGGEAVLDSPRLRYELVISVRKDAQGIDTLSVEHEQLTKISSQDDEWSKTYLNNHTPIWKTSRSGGTREPFIKTTLQGGIPIIFIHPDGTKGNKAVASKSTPANRISQTILGGINSIDFPHAFAVKEEMRTWRFMQLNPEVLRQPTLQDAKINYEISPVGANLASALFRIKNNDPEDLARISRLLGRFLPEYIAVDDVNDTVNNQFIIKLKNKDGKEFSSRVLSEGTLRLLTLCIMQYDNMYTGLLCFEEPENGIHPRRIKDMVELLEGLSVDFEEENALLRQVIVNTHSPKFIRIIQSEKRLNPYVNVWLSKMVPLVTTTPGGNRTTIRITKITSVDTKVTALDLEDYLETNDE